MVSNREAFPYLPSAFAHGSGRKRRSRAAMLNEAAQYSTLSRPTAIDEQILQHYRYQLALLDTAVFVSYLLQDWPVIASLLRRLCEPHQLGRERTAEPDTLHVQAFKSQYQPAGSTSSHVGVRIKEGLRFSVRRG